MSDKVLRFYSGQDPCDESRQLFERLADEANNGVLVGAVVISIYARGRSSRPYFLSLSGRARRDPTYAAGALSACHVLVQELALEDAGLL